MVNASKEHPILPVPGPECLPGCIAEADAEERAKALNMMRMLANRQNSRWLEAKEWDVPYTFDATKFPTLLGTLDE